MASILPHPKTLLTKIISSLPLTSSTNANPLRSASQKTKHLLQTLHVLYPNEFLPALDLLDRHLITRLVIKSPQDPTTLPNPASEVSEMQETETVIPLSPSHQAEGKLPSSPPTTTDRRQERIPRRHKTCIYYVRSAQPQKPSYIPGGNTGRTYDALSTHYEVRPLAWNCSCPAFSFAAFPAITEDDGDAIQTGVVEGRREEMVARGGETSEDDWGWRFGGLSLGRGAPVCKHLLACVLVERCEAFVSCVEERSVSVEEVAGLCAGWGG
jgi:hypothetical protein